MPPRAVVYARRSKDEAGSRSVEEQIALCESFCRGRGWDYTVVSEIGAASSFARKPRAVWAEVLAMIERGEVEYVVAWAQDRLVRLPLDMLRLQELCRRHGASVALVSTGSIENYSTSGGRIGSLVTAGIAAEEMEANSLRIRRNTASRAASGGVHGRTLFGYSRRYSDKDGTLAEVYPHKTQADWVRMIFQLYVEEGLTAYGVASKMNALDAPTRRSHITDGRKALGWTGAAVAEVLRNPAYAGVRRHRSIDPLTREETVATYKANWEALVDQETWQRAQTRLDGNPAMPPTRPKSLLGGILLCGVCGGPMYVGKNNRGSKRVDGTRPSYPVMVCVARATGQRAGHCAIARHHVESFLVDVLLSRIAADDFLTGVREVEDESAAEAQALIASIKADEDYLADVARTASETRDWEMLTQQRTLVTPRIDEAKARLGRLRRIDPTVVQLRGTSDIRSAWESLPLTTQRAILSGILVPLVQRAEKPGQRGLEFVARRIEIIFKT